MGPEGSTVDNVTGIHFMTRVLLSAGAITVLIPVESIPCFTYQYYKRPRPPAAGQYTMVADPVSPSIVSPTMPLNDDYVTQVSAPFPTLDQVLPSVVEQLFLSPVCEPATDVLFFFKSIFMLLM